MYSIRENRSPLVHTSNGNLEWCTQRVGNISFLSYSTRSYIIDFIFFIDIAIERNRTEYRLPLASELASHTNTYVIGTSTRDYSPLLYPMHL